MRCLRLTECYTWCYSVTFIILLLTSFQAKNQGSGYARACVQLPSRPEPRGEASGENLVGNYRCRAEWAHNEIDVPALVLHHIIINASAAKSKPIVPLTPDGGVVHASSDIYG